MKAQNKAKWGNSVRFDFVAVIVVAVLGIGCGSGCGLAKATEIKFSVPPSFREASQGVFRLDGPITASTLLEAQRVLSLVEPGRAVVVLNSPGGDVMAAIELGRLLRAKRATANAIECASACVLVFAGATGRLQTNHRGDEVVIHRPYFASASANPTQEETQTRFSVLRNTVRNYLQEMNVSPTLWDAMVAISPSDARALTDEELISYGLVATDPVEEEMERQEMANRWQTTPQEILRREVLASRTCYTEEALSKYSFAEASDCADYFKIGGVEVGRAPADYSFRIRRVRNFCTSEALESAMDEAEDKNDIFLLHKLLRKEELCQQRQAQRDRWTTLFDVE